MSEILSNNTEEVVIRNRNEFKERLGLTYDLPIQELDTLIRTTQTELYYLRSRLNNRTTQAERMAEVEKFIQQQRENEGKNIQSDTREGLSNIAT